ncbi:MAG: hypothetical protein ACFHVJ_11100 [Aestuariibacter sp.]
MLLSAIPLKASANWWYCYTDFRADTKTLTWKANKRNLQTIRMDIRFDRRTDECVTELLVFTDNDPNIRLYSSSDSVGSELVNKQRQIYPQYVINGRIAYVIPVYRDKKIRVFAELTTNEALIAGDYQGHVSIIASSYGYAASREVVATFNMEVPSILSVDVQTRGNSAVYGNNGYYHVDLGRMYQGKRIDWNIEIYSNAHYDISVASEYKGLRHRGSGEIVHYDVIMDGVRFGAASGYRRRYTNYNPLTDTTIGFAVEVGNTDFKPAGKYVDYLMVTVSAR